MRGRYAAKRLAVVLACTLLISGMVAFGIPNTSYDGEVKETEGAIVTGAAIAAGILGGAAAGAIGCKIFCDDPDNIDVNDTSQATKTGYSALANINSEQDDIQAFSENYGKYAAAPAMSEAKLTMIEEYNSGASETTMKIEGKAELRDGISRIQSRIIDGHNNAVEGINKTIVGYKDAGIGNRLQIGTGLGGNSIDRLNRSYTLANGTSVNGSAMNVQNSNGYLRLDGRDNRACCPDDDTKLKHAAVDIDSDGTNEYKERVMYEPEKLYAEFQRLGSQSSTLSNDLDQIASDITSNFQRGELNASEVTSPYERAANYASRWNETGSNKYAKAFAEQVGLDRGNASFSITLEDGTELDGSLFAEPFSSVEDGLTYYYGADTNKSAVPDSQYWNDSETVLFTETDGTTRDLTQNFSVSSLTNPETGESLNSTGFKQNEWTTTNTSELPQLIERLNEIQEAYAPDGGGFGLGGLGGEGPLGVPWIVWILGGGIVLVAFAGRE
jgi:hypothetical protein